MVTVTRVGKHLRATSANLEHHVRKESRLAGLPEAEGREPLAFLRRHIVQPEFLYRHSWRPGHLLMRDDAAVQHQADFDHDPPLRRRSYRTTVRGPAISD